MAKHQVRVGPLPPWVDPPRLLGPGDWRALSVEAASGEPGHWVAALDTGPAADLEARLRKLVLDGRPLLVTVTPPLRRAAVRSARSAEARRRWDRSPGWVHPDAQVDPEGRWSLTPEALALALGRAAVTALGPGARVLDAGCGAGGNAVGFARAGCRVEAVERDGPRLAMARHNAEIYGVADRITFRAGEAGAAMAEARADLLFVDPPWGLDWRRPGLGIEALPLLAEALRHRGRYRAVWAKLPPSFELDSLDPAVPASSSVRDALRCEAVYGVRDGDRRQIKFLLTRLGGAPDGARL